MGTVRMVIEKIFRRINRLLFTERLYDKYFCDGIVWNDSILFESFTGQSFQGDPYYIFKDMFLSNEFNSMRFYIAVVNVKEWKEKLVLRNLYGKNVKIIARDSHKYVSALSHSKYLVNNVGFNSAFIKKENQIYLNTWHGTGPKCCGKKLIESPAAFKLPQHNFIIADYLIAPNNHIENMIVSDHMLSYVEEGKIRKTGCPRNAVFFDNNIQSVVREKIKCKTKTVVAYLPTWRGKEQLSKDVEAILSIDRIADSMRETHVFYYKLHPNIMMESKIVLKNCHLIPDDFELYEFLSCVDILITDWSSVYVDFACKNSQIILYQYDREYMLSKRGLYQSIVDDMKFQIAEDEEDLLSFLNKKTKPAVTRYFMDTYCKYEGEDSIKSSVDLMMSKKERHLPAKVSIIYTDKMIPIANINMLREKYQTEKIVFVLPDDLPNNVFSYFNGIDSFEYIPIPVADKIQYDTVDRNINTIRIIEETTKKYSRSLFGNLQIDAVYRCQTEMIPISLMAISHNTINEA